MRDKASFLIYLGCAAVALTFAGVMLFIAWPIFSMPADKTCVYSTPHGLVLTDPDCTARIQ